MSVPFDSPTPYSEEWWRVTLSSIGDAVVVTDAKGRVAFMNPVAESLTGWNSQEAKSRPLDEVFPIINELSRASVTNPVDEVLRTGAVVELANHTILRAKNGSEVPIDDSAAPIKDEQGNIFGVVLVFRDITERQRAAATRRQLSAIVESSDDAIISKNLDGIITSWNKAAERIYGYTAAEVLGQPVSILIPPDRVDEIPAILERLRHGERIEHYETVRRRKDGTPIDVSLTISPIKDNEGHVIGASKIARDITERKQAETARAYLAAIIASADDAIISKTLESVITSWNQAAEQMFGYTAAEAIGQQIYLIIPPERHAEETQILERLKRGKRVDHFETVRRRKDGTLIDVSLTISPIKNSEGQIIGASKIARDISERKRAEQEREELLARERRARQRFAFLAQATELLSSTLDYETTLKNLAQLVVPQFADWCGVDILAEDGSIQRVTVAHQDPDKIAFAEEVARRYPPDPESPRGVPQVLRTGQPELYPEIPDELLVKSASDAEHLELLRAVGLKSGMIVPLVARGRTLGALTFVNGESDRRYAQEDLDFAQDLARRAALAVDNARLYQETQHALREREEVLQLHRSVEERLSVLVEASNTLLGRMRLEEVQQAVIEIAGRLIAADAYAVWRKDLRTDIWRVATAIGLSAEFQDAVPSDRDSAAARLEGPLAIESVQDVPWLAHRQAAYQLEGIESLLALPLRLHGEVASSITFYYRNPHHFSEMEIRVATALANLAAAALGTAELYQDQSRLRSEAEEANRLKDEFLATVSHELRTPLNSMFGWIRMLRAGRVNEADKARALEIIDRNAQAQAQIIEDILDMSRIITGKLRLDLQPVELPLVIEAAVDSIRPAAEAREIKLQVLLDTKAGPVLGDPNRLQQIIWNLLSNSVKFTPKGGRVRVQLERINSHVEITVADTGHGISPEFLPHVFDRFRQADSSNTRAHGGLGLGLAVVRHLVELHGGTVSAASAGEGQGATFTVRLPLTVVRDTPDRLPSRAKELFGDAREASWTLALPPDLTGVRVLIVDDEADARELLTAVIGQCGAEVAVAASAMEGLDTVREWQPQVIVSDIGMPDEDGYNFIRRVRTLPPEAGGNTPAAALTAYARMEDRVRALSAGYQTHVAKPVDPAELAAVVASLAGRTGRT
jgi:PAS domain S-box-containing protein